MTAIAEKPDETTAARPAHRVALVGAGYIANTHAAVLHGMGDRVSLHAVVDAHAGRAAAFARKWKIPNCYADLPTLLRVGSCDVAHVLVPPDLHRRVAAPLLEAGVNVLLEKPMAATAAECAALEQAAASGHASLGINHNFMFHPAMLGLRRCLDTGRLGRLRHVVAWQNMPLRQLGARQYGHWMFATPLNLLLEQAVHPLSQIRSLIGPITAVTRLAGPPKELTASRILHDTWQVALTGEQATAQITLSYGQEFPCWGLIAICDDGSVQADITNNRVTITEKSRWPLFFDSFLAGAGTAKQALGQACRDATGYILSTAGLRPPADSFFLSMQSSIRAFYDGLVPGVAQRSAAFGSELIGLCERIVGDLPLPARRPAVPRPARWDVAVLGGTGFIGSHLVRQLLHSGKKVAVMARSTHALPPLFDDPRIALLNGDTGRREDVERAIGEAGAVVNLAQGVGGETAAEIEQAMVGAAVTVAEACLARPGTRLVHISSIAALYLGDPAAMATGASPTDPQTDHRGPYARAKAASEAALLALHRDRALPLTILRPGLVVGEGGLPFHSGLGFFNAERHCMGWNRGINPLPFVLAEDVAAAIRLALDNPAAAEGRCFNLVGDVRLDARDYIAELAKVLERDLHFHPQSVQKLQLVEIGKWLVKRAAGRAVPFPPYRDLRSRGLETAFDCSDIKQALGWSPVADRATFIRRAIAINRAASPRPELTLLREEGMA